MELKKLVAVLDKAIEDKNKSDNSQPKNTRELVESTLNRAHLMEKIENFVPNHTFRGRIENPETGVVVPAEKGHESGHSVDEIIDYVNSGEYNPV